MFHGFLGTLPFKGVAEQFRYMGGGGGGAEKKNLTIAERNEQK